MKQLSLEVKKQIHRLQQRSSQPDTDTDRQTDRQTETGSDRDRRTDLLLCIYPARTHDLSLPSPSELLAELKVFIVSVCTSVCLQL